MDNTSNGKFNPPNFHRNFHQTKEIYAFESNSFVKVCDLKFVGRVSSLPFMFRCAGRRMDAIARVLVRARAAGMPRTQ